MKRSRLVPMKTKDEKNLKRLRDRLTRNYRQMMKDKNIENYVLVFNTYDRESPIVDIAGSFRHRRSAALGMLMMAINVVQDSEE